MPYNFVSFVLISIAHFYNIYFHFNCLNVNKNMTIEEEDEDTLVFIRKWS